MATEIDKNIRKGIKLYIDYFENEFEEVSDEELGILIRGLYQYDQYKKLDEEYSEKINNNILLKTLFKIICKNNDRAVAEWNRKREYYKKKDWENDMKKISLHNFNIFGILFSIELPKRYHLSNEKLEKEFESAKQYAEMDPEWFKNIVNDTFITAMNDEFKKSIKEYCSEIMRIQ